MIKVCKGVSSYMGMGIYKMIKMIKVCRHTWGCIQDDKGVVIHWDVYKMIKVCRHTWGFIQDDKGVSSYMGMYTR